ncbi:MAG: AAA family ATPase [Bacteroidales bacterium]
MNIQAFVSALTTKGVVIPQRFKLEKYVKQMPELLKQAYLHQVQSRGCIYQQNSNVEHFIEKAAKWLVDESAKFGLLIYGTVGNGKTTLARAICNTIKVLYYSEWSLDRKSVSITSALDLSKNAMENKDLFEKLKNSEMLFIDDIGLEPRIVKSWGNDFTPLVEVLIHRYERQLFTIATSNLCDKDFEPQYGERVSDRMKEMFDRLPFQEKSFRK